MKILIIGFGSIAKKHLGALRTIIPKVEVYALRSRTNAEQHENMKNIYSLSEIKISELDFIIISNPTSKHFGTLKSLKEFKTPLFIEKPLFSDVGKEMEDLIKDLENRNTLTYVACNLRFFDSLLHLNKLLVSERINEVNVYCGSYLPNWRPTQNFRKSYSANKDLGGGVHIDLIHELDYLYWMFGAPKRAQSFFSSKSSLKITAFDYANYLWEYDSFSANIILNYYRPQSKRTIEVLTRDNIYAVDLLKNEVKKNDELVFSSNKGILDTYQDQMDFFIKQIKAGSVKFNTVKEAYEILKLCIQD